MRLELNEERRLALLHACAACVMTADNQQPRTRPFVVLGELMNELDRPKPTEKVECPPDVLEWLTEGNSKEDLADQLWEHMTIEERDSLIDEAAAENHDD